MRSSPSTDHPDPVLDPPPRASTPSLLPLAASAAAWGVTVTAIALAGGFETEARIPLALLVAAAAPPGAFGVAWLRSAAMRQWARGFDLRIIVATQLWRVVGATFLFLSAAGALAGSFAWPAGFGDIATGTAALVVLTALLRGSLTRRGLVAFTTLGLGDFTVAFAVTAVIPPEGMSSFPLVLFPTVAVPWFTVLHLLALAQLSQLPSPTRRPAPGS